MCTVNQNGQIKRKFSWTEMVTSGFNGESSASGFCGVIACVVSMILLLVLIVFYMFNLPEAGTIMALIDKLILLFGVGASLLGLRKVSGMFGSKGREPIQNLENLQEVNRPNQNHSC